MFAGGLMWKEYFTGRALEEGRYCSWDLQRLLGTWWDRVVEGKKGTVWCGTLTTEFTSWELRNAIFIWGSDLPLVCKQMPAGNSLWLPSKHTQRFLSAALSVGCAVDRDGPDTLHTLGLSIRKYWVNRRCPESTSVSSHTSKKPFPGMRWGSRRRELGVCLKISGVGGNWDQEPGPLACTGMPRQPAAQLTGFHGLR